jgi:hypothetical protein
MLEKFIVGDRVMLIPAKEDSNNMALPYGACGTVMEAEGIQTAVDGEGRTSKKYGCVVDFDNKPCYYAGTSGYWFRIRDGLMKIDSDDKLKEEESENIKLDNSQVIDITK